VSCTTASACTAVGQSNGMPVAERWNGTSWTVQTPPTPSGAVSAALYSVSCTTSAACTAVGYSGNGSSPSIYGDAPLAESWNGSTWTLQTAPNPSQATSGTLTGISCIAPDACTAVGGYDDQNTTPVSYGTLAEQLNASTWTIQPTPAPAGSAGSALSGVSCTTNSACTAVGYYNDNAYPEISGDAPLAENWNGTAWSVQPTPNPPATDISTLAQVSCASATVCTAVGGLSFFYSYPINVTLTERYSG
jgi:hypothetical protein